MSDTTIASKKGPSGPQARWYDAVDVYGVIKRVKGREDSVESFEDYSEQVLRLLAREGYVSLRRAGIAPEAIADGSAFPDRVAPAVTEAKAPGAPRAVKVSTGSKVNTLDLAIIAVKKTDLQDALLAGGVAVDRAKAAELEARATEFVQGLTKEQKRLLLKNPAVKLARSTILGNAVSLDDILGANVTADADAPIACAAD